MCSQFATRGRGDGGDDVLARRYVRVRVFPAGEARLVHSARYAVEEVVKSTLGFVNFADEQEGCDVQRHGSRDDVVR